MSEMPNVIGYHPAEAEETLTAASFTVVNIIAPPPRWMPANRSPRIGRQRTLPDGTVELLVVEVPESPDGEENSE
ncbi:MAG: hypothetical protein WCJ56_13390 [bacterium]